MTILLVQTFLLLLGAFLLGASLACLVRRGFAGRQPEPVVPAASAGLAAAPAVHAGDADRFGRALTGGHGVAAPAEPATGPVVEVQPRPPVRVSPLIEPVEAPPAPVAAEPAPEPEPLPTPEPQLEAAPAPSPEPAPEPQRAEQSYTQIAVAAAAGAAAIAAARGLDAPETRDDRDTQDATADAASESSYDDGRSYTEIATGIAAGGLAVAAAGGTEPESEPEEAADDEADAGEAAADDTPVEEEPSAEADALAEAEADVADQEPATEASSVSSRFGTPIADAIVPLAASEETGDDLTRIHSIDAALRARLNRLGVTRFSEIGAWSASDLTHFSQSLGVVPGRIEQENWVGQAQVLASGGVTDYPRWRGPELMPRAALPADGERLHRIIGIDPDSEAILRANGVTGLLDVAAWTEEDVSWYERILGTPGRIGRENWVEQARFLTRGSGIASAIESVSAPIAGAAAAAAAGVAAVAVASEEEDTEPAAREEAEPEVADGEAAEPEPAELEAAELETVEPETEVSDADASSSEPGQPFPGPRSEAVAGLRSVRSEAFKGSGSGFGGPVTGEVDDLKRIRGIGVLIEKKLHSLGVISYEQVANWTGEDVDRISQLLDFKGRIERENWIEQARILASGGQTEFSRRVDRGEA